MGEARTPTLPHPRASWFRSLGFGLFIHWGPFSVLGRGEWSIADERIPLDEYDRIVLEFKAENYDPRRWVALARSAGMRYLTLTACHGNGYCLFDTKTYDRNAVKGAPGRDLVREFVDACREGGMAVGLYYSLTNWYEYYKRFGAYRAVSNPLENPMHRESWRELVAMQREQIRELLTNYGDIDIFWLDDTPHVPESYDAEGLYEMIRTLQPGCLVGENNRNCGHGDFDISEERFLDRVPERPWEVCMPMAIRWSYQPSDTNYKSVATLLGMLRRCVLWKGNFLLNTGPYADGAMQPAQERILHELGDWLRKYGKALWGCQPLIPGHLEWGEVVTWDGAGTVYLHVDRWFGPTWTFSGLENRVLHVEVMGTGQPVRFSQSEPHRLTFLDLPEHAPDAHCSVIALKIHGTPVMRPWVDF